MKQEQEHPPRLGLPRLRQPWQLLLRAFSAAHSPTMPCWGEAATCARSELWTASTLHKVAGKLMCTVAVVQMWLGFDLLEVDTLYRALWGVWLAVVIGAFLWAEFNKVETTGDTATPDDVETKRQDNPLQDDSE